MTRIIPLLVGSAAVAAVIVFAAFGNPTFAQSAPPDASQLHDDEKPLVGTSEESPKSLTDFTCAK